ncbi:hypothetical protein C8R45DRAFT_1101315 [Mycena sanguinolenta]|nr:hypothetical protein C8R45DRAFT_1101315 [Mycena sanguinolenta]
MNCSLARAPSAIAQYHNFGYDFPPPSMRSTHTDSTQARASIALTPTHTCSRFVLPTYDLAMPPLHPPLAKSSLHTTSTLEPKSTRKTTPRLKRPLSARKLLDRPRYRRAALRVGGVVGIPRGRAPEEWDRGHHRRKETETRIHRATQQGQVHGVAPIDIKRRAAALHRPVL